MPGIKGQKHRKSGKRNARSKAWQAMRILRTFTYSQLQATTDINYDNLKKINQKLCQAGYVRRIKKHPGRPGEDAIFRLVRNTGPAVPICGKTCLYDPNLQEEVEYGK